MPAPPPPQPPLAGELEALSGRQIFIDDINESKAGLGLAYSPPFVVSDSRRVQETNDIPLILEPYRENVTSTDWNVTDYGDDDLRFWRKSALLLNYTLDSCSGFFSFCHRYATLGFRGHVPVPGLVGANYHRGPETSVSCPLSLPSKNSWN